jgi:predicted transposase YbfD/YdcC
LSIQIVEAGGKYVWVVKDNQPETRKAIETLFQPAAALPGTSLPANDFRTAHTTGKEHGRIEQRTLTTSSLLKDYLPWPYVEQVFRLERRRLTVATGQVEHEVVYGLTALTAQEAGPERLLGLMRDYWGIENGLHYRRDVTLHEDATRLLSPRLAEVMALINNLVIGLTLHEGWKNLAQALLEIMRQQFVPKSKRSRVALLAAYQKPCIMPPTSSPGLVGLFRDGCLYPWRR